MDLRNLSIQRKLTLLAMLTSSIAVVVSSRQLLSQDLNTQAQIVAYGSAAAMAFKDEASATVMLSAFSTKEEIVAAVLYTPDGKMFAHYFRQKVPAPLLPERLDEKGSRITDNYIEVFSDVTLRGERVGTLFLQSDMQRWNKRASQYAGILGTFLVLSALVA